MQKAKADGVDPRRQGPVPTPRTSRAATPSLAMAWSGDMVQAQIDKPSLKFNLATEGGMLWTDNMMIPKGAAHKGTAELLINYYYDPAVSAQSRGRRRLHLAGQGLGRDPDRRPTRTPRTTRCSSRRPTGSHGCTSSGP